MPVSEEKEHNSYKRCHKWGFIILILIAVILAVIIIQQISKPRQIVPVDFATAGLANISDFSPDLLLIGRNIAL